MSPSLSQVPDVDEALADAVSECLTLVDERLREVVSTPDPMAQWTARHLLDAGGKRIRPMLTLLAASFGDMHREEVLNAAVLVELTHLASLYHDDVMDSASTRRGGPTAHEVWGNSVAILTGDYLFARASALSACIGTDAVGIHARTFERLCLGQLHETIGVQDGEDPFDHYLRVLSDKTASLIGTAGEFGARYSGGPESAVQIMRDYGEKVGIAFQLADDVIDLRSDPDQSGKTPGTDLREGIPTMPSLLVRARHAAGDTSPETVEVVRLLDEDLSSDRALRAAVASLAQDPAVEETERLARTTAEDAVTLLENLPDAPAREALISFTRALVDRAS
ncbi:MAG: polyprenyl synthetase family protein [Brachybacterium sp.]|nr:polyprenyl synthetase family protein [Brachybacterium sp.]